SRTERTKAARRRTEWSRVAAGPEFRDEGRARRRVRRMLAILAAIFGVVMLIGALNEYETQGKVTAITSGQLIVKRNSCDCIVVVPTDDPYSYTVGSTIDIPGASSPWTNTVMAVALFSVPLAFGARALLRRRRRTRLVRGGPVL